MSEIKLSADSGGGTTSLKGPASTTGNAALAYTLPNATTGGVIRTTTTPGAIIQVTNTTTDTIQTLAATNQWLDSLITCAITPSSTSNKILISLTATGEGNAADQNRFTHRIKKVISGGATTYLAGDETDRVGLLGSTGDLSNNATTSASSFSVSNYMDSPSTTSAVTYTLQITFDNATGAGTYYLNRNASDGTGGPRYISWITLMEVAG